MADPGLALSAIQSGALSDGCRLSLLERSRAITMASSPLVRKSLFREGLLHHGFAGFSFFRGWLFKHQLSHWMTDLYERLGQRVDDFRWSVEDLTETLEPDALADHQRWRESLLVPAQPLSDGPAATKTLFRALATLPRDFDEPAWQGVVFMKVQGADPDRRPGKAQCADAHYLTLPTLEDLGEADLLSGVALSRLYYALCRAESACDQSMVMLKPDELEVMRWAVAGKTVEDIAAITGLRTRTVRFHLDRVRRRYGFATVRQTLVKVAIDYRLDVLGA